MKYFEKNFVVCRYGEKFSKDDLMNLNCAFVLGVKTGQYHLYLLRDLLCGILKSGLEIIGLDEVHEHQFNMITDRELLDFIPGEVHYTLVVDGLGDVMGIIDDPVLFSRFCADANYRIHNGELQEENFRRILNNMEDDVFITDEYGFVTYFNPRSEALMGVTAKDYIGHHVSEMIQDEIFPESLSMKVIATGEKQMEIQDLKTGIRIINSAQPVYDENGRLVQVLSTSKHIDEITEKVADLTQELASSNEQIRRLQKQVIDNSDYVFESEPMQQIQKTLMKIAPSDITVLIEGESGAGKEVIADTVYKFSARKDKPFIKINCGTIPKDLMESELFGYEPGAFTGALKDGKKGKLEIADGGTVFLDEIGEMELAMQVKLLEFLQDHQIVRVGGTKRIPVDARIIAATNKDLFSMVEEGTFRRDLYYRLNVMPIYVPPLRERREDIAPLIFTFLNKFNKKYGFDRHIDNNVIEKFCSFDWPGNVRELMHAVERVVVASDYDYINEVALGNLFTETGTSRGSVITANAKVICTELMPLKEAKHELEKYLVTTAYNRFGSSYKAAKFLQVNQSTVSRWMQKADGRNKTK